MRRAVFAVTALLLLFALAAERMDFVQDYAGLDAGIAKVSLADGDVSDSQDNELFILPETAAYHRFPLVAYKGVSPIPEAVQAVYLPELRPPAFA